MNLSRGGIERAGCYGELWLRPLSQDLLSARVLAMRISPETTGLTAIPRKNSPIVTATIAMTIAAKTMMSINTKASI